MSGALSVTNGLVGWYKGEDWTGTQWPDLSGSGNHVTTTAGVVKSHGRYIYGGQADSLTFPPAILPATYTLFHVAKYTGALRGRIFQGTTKNWLSGFWATRAGIAYHEYWLVNANISTPLHDVLISTDQKNLYRANGVNLTINSGTGVSDRIAINTGLYPGDYSEWAVSEVIVYNRELSLAEIQSVEAYLTTRKTDIDLKTIQSYLGGTDPISLNEYYGGTGYAPSSGTLSLNNFRRLQQVPITGIPLNKLQVCLDASDVRSYPGSGTTWYDISGNGRNGTWNSVSYQGSYFETSGRWCSGPPSNSFGITDTSGYTVFFVFKQNALSNTGAFKFFGNGTSNRGVFSHCTWGNGIIYFDQGGCCGSDTRLTAGLPSPTGTWHAVAIVRETNSSTRHIYIDGALASSLTATAAALQLISNNVSYVGDYQVYPGSWNAQIKCFLAYNRGLTAAEITTLTVKWLELPPFPTGTTAFTSTISPSPRTFNRTGSGSTTLIISGPNGPNVLPGLDVHPNNPVTMRFTDSAYSTTADLSFNGNTLSSAQYYINASINNTFNSRYNTGSNPYVYETQVNEWNATVVVALRIHVPSTVSRVELFWTKTEPWAGFAITF